MEMTFILQVFGRKLKHLTNKNFELMKLDEKLRIHQSYYNSQLGRHECLYQTEIHSVGYR